MQEGAGRSLESMDSLFQRPWYTVYQVAYPTADELKIEGRDMKATEIEGICEGKRSADAKATHVE